MTSRTPASLNTLGKYCVYTRLLSKEEALENLIAIAQSPDFDEYEFSCTRMSTNYLAITPQASWLGGYDPVTSRHILLKEIRPLVVPVLQFFKDAPATKVDGIWFNLTATQPYGVFTAPWLEANGSIGIAMECGANNHLAFRNPPLDPADFQDMEQYGAVGEDFKRWRRDMHRKLMATIPHK